MIFLEKSICFGNSKHIRDGPDALSGRLSGRISGGKIGRIAGYHFGILIKLSKVKGKHAKIFLVKIFISVFTKFRSVNNFNFVYNISNL